MHCVSLILCPLRYLIIEMTANPSVLSVLMPGVESESVSALQFIERLEELDDIDGLSWWLFTASGCAPCQDIKRKLPQWGHEFLPSSQSFCIDLSLLPQASAAFQVLSVPTLVVCLDGQEIARQVRHINFTLLKEQLARPVALWQASLFASGG